MTATPDSVGDAPAPDEIRAQIERMTVSDVFIRSPQLGAFLRFVVQAALQGKADRIKAYTIGVEVLRRDAKFDPQLDPIVRVEATRLRRAIERYYSGPGADDAIVVDLPRGSYVPLFRRRAAVRDTSSRKAWRNVLLSGRMRGTTAIWGGIVAAVLVVVAILLSGLHRTPLPGAPTFMPMAGTPRPGNGMPVLQVHKLEGLGLRDGRSRIEAALFDAMQGLFPRFDTINILFEPADRAIAADKIVDYRLTGSIELRADASVSAKYRLLDNIDGTIAWSGEFLRIAAARKLGAIENQIAVELATKLFQPYGVIRSHQRAKHLSGSAGDPRYRCVVEASESFRSFDSAQHSSARACLEQLTAAHPDFANGFAYLAAVYFREDQYGFGAQPGDAPPLDRALRAARRAIELNPESARSYQLLFAVLFGRRDLAAAFAAGDKAMALNPSDMTIVSDYGGRLILVGQIERGMGLLQKAGEHGAIRPSWYHFYVFLGRYLNGDTAAAASEADQITAEGFQLGHVARALAAVHRDDRERARAEFGRLIALQPAWRDDPRRQLAKFIPGPEIVDRLARDLVAAGLSGQP